MSAERLRALVEQGNLINLNVVSDTLGNLLNEISQMLAEQQKQIAEISKKLTDKVDITDYKSFYNQYMADNDRNTEFIPKIEEKMSKLSKDLDEKVNNIKNHIDSTNDQNIITCETTINQKMGVLEADIQYVNQRMDLIDKALKNVTPNSGVADSSSNKLVNEVELLRKRVEKLESNVKNENSEWVSKEVIDQLNEYFESRLEEMAGKIQNKASSGQDFSTNNAAGCKSARSVNGDSRNIDVVGVIEENEELEQDRMEQTIDLVKQKVEDINRDLTIKLEHKADITLVERMFEKMRVIMTHVNDDISFISEKTDQFITKKEFEAEKSGILALLTEKDRKQNQRPLHAFPLMKRSSTKTSTRSNQAPHPSTPLESVDP